MQLSPNTGSLPALTQPVQPVGADAQPRPRFSAAAVASQTATAVSQPSRGEAARAPRDLPAGRAGDGPEAEGFNPRAPRGSYLNLTI